MGSPQLKLEQCYKYNNFYKTFYKFNKLLLILIFPSINTILLYYHPLALFYYFSFTCVKETHLNRLIPGKRGHFIEKFLFKNPKSNPDLTKNKCETVPED